MLNAVPLIHVTYLETASLLNEFIVYLISEKYKKQI
jgi:hypothetical protein